MYDDLGSKLIVIVNTEYILSIGENKWRKKKNLRETNMLHCRNRDLFKRIIKSE